MAICVFASPESETPLILGPESEIRRVLSVEQAGEPPKPHLILKLKSGERHAVPFGEANTPVIQNAKTALVVSVDENELPISAYTIPVGETRPERKRISVQDADTLIGDLLDKKYTVDVIK